MPDKLRFLIELTLWMQGLDELVKEYNMEEDFLYVFCSTVGIGDATYSWNIDDAEDLDLLCAVLMQAFEYHKNKPDEGEGGWMDGIIWN
jgi:hypothetical protein